MRRPIPPIDVPPIDLKTGRWTIDWYDYVKGLKLSDLADVSATPAANGQVMIWNAAQNRWVPGSN
jgi:hypothetical protein